MARDGQPRGLLPRFNPELAATALELGERLADQLHRTAEALEERTRFELRGQSISRVETGAAGGGGGLVEVTLGPAQGSVWQINHIGLSVPNGAAARAAAIYLGDRGDTSRPLYTQTNLGLAAQEGIGTVAPPIFPLQTTRGVYVRFLALAANEVGVVHVVAREWASI